MSLPEMARRDVVELNPSDPVFDRWASEAGDASKTLHIGHTGFLWLPERGMGRLRVTDPPYDAAYFENYVRLARTPMGAAITEARVALVDRYTDRHVVDVGIGCGAFIEGRGGWTWGYDVNPEGVRWLRAQGRWRDPYEKPVEAVSLWDVIEHIEEPHKLLRNVVGFVFASLPIVPDDGPPTADWKHWKPREHIWYWTEAGFVRWMAAHGFRLLQRSRRETELGRQDIGTFAFEREREA